MSDLWPIPAGPHALRELEVRDKGDWKGVTAHIAGAGMWLGRNLVGVSMMFSVVAICGFFIPHGQWVSVAGGICTLICLVLLKLGVSELCERAYSRFIQVIGGRIYRPAGRLLSQSILDHESCHDWQQRNRRGYVLLYTLSPAYRRHAEAMAYALEVVAHGRDPEEAARTAADPVYVMFWEPRDARVLIDAYVELFSEQWPNPARWESPTAEVP